MAFRSRRGRISFRRRRSVSRSRRRKGLRLRIGYRM